MKKHHLNHHGFHLIEIVIVLAIVAILAAISIPTYSHYLVSAKRLEAKSTLAKMALALEQYYIEHDSYRDATLEILHISNTSSDYQFIIQSAAENTYLLAAVPLNHQAGNDSTCGTLSLNSLGEKMISGSGNVNDCW